MSGTEASRGLGVSLSLPDGWSTRGLEDGGRTTRLQIDGTHPGEGFVAVRLDGADATAELAGWIEFPMAVSGGMDPELLFGVDAEVVTWREEDGELFVEQLGADEALSYSGLLSIDGTRLRTYVVLARIDDVAWKTTLTLADAVGPEADDDEVDRSDHSRARLYLGSLVLSR